MHSRLFNIVFLLSLFMFSCGDSKSTQKTPEIDAALVKSNKIIVDKIIISKISELMTLQESCWNCGDLDCFMKPYLHSDSLMFVGKSGITYGWQETLDNYKKGYPTTEKMGHLNFTNIKIIPLSDSSCYVIGKWHLVRTIGDLEGHYTLLWRKIDGKWVIIADHSS